MSINPEKKKVIPIVMDKEKHDLIKEIRINQYGGNISVGAMYRILLDRGYEETQQNIQRSVRTNPLRPK